MLVDSEGTAPPGLRGTARARKKNDVPTGAGASVRDVDGSFLDDGAAGRKVNDEEVKHDEKADENVEEVKRKVKEVKRDSQL